MKKLIITCFILLFFLSFIVGCGSIGKLAQDVLYPAEQVNKNFPPIKKGEAPWQEEDFDGIYSYSGIDPASDSVIIYLAGNGECLASGLPLFDLFYKLKISFISVDYPSYGWSAGFPEEKTLREAAQKAIQYVKSRWPNKKIILWGRSLGSAVALQAYDPSVNKVILVSPFTNFEEAAKAMSFLGRLVPKEFIARNTYDSRNKIKLVTSPILILHGDKDDLVPYKMGVELSLTNPNARLLTINGASHNDIYGREELFREVVRFIEE